MVPILVLVSVAGFLLADWLLRRKRAVEAPTLLKSPIMPRVELEPSGLALEPAADLRFHPGHTWARRAGGNLVAVGSDAFAPRFLGKIAQVLLPRPGMRFRQGDPAWALVSERGRELAMAMPVDGEVIEVNRRLVSEPELVQRAPYASGWVLRIRPDHAAASFQNLMPAIIARDWLTAIRSRITTRLSPTLGFVATDGGEWTEVFGDQLDEATWQSLKCELFPEVSSGNH